MYIRRNIQQTTNRTATNKIYTEQCGTLDGLNQIKYILRVTTKEMWEDKSFPFAIKCLVNLRTPNTCVKK